MSKMLEQAPFLPRLKPPAALADPLRGKVADQVSRLLAYVQRHQYEGWDLFDGLNSRLFRHSPLYKSRLFRLALIQFCKQSPVNLRSLLMVPKGFNAKGGALFLMGHLNLYRATGEAQYLREAEMLFARLRETAIARPHGIAWGYNFDWQARAFYVPVGTPNLVTSVYVGRALLAYHKITGKPEALEMALGISEFILHEMIKFETEKALCFNYIPGKDAEVHNANLLGASYLAQVLDALGPDRQGAIRDKILKAVRFSVSDIQPDGSWPYGTKPFHRWVDNFHTAFNIECLTTVAEHLQTDEFDAIIQQVTEYYLNHLFTEEGLPKYYNNKLYPIDVHVLAESIVLLNLLREKKAPQAQNLLDETRVQVIEKALLDLSEEFQDRDGWFYYQKRANGFVKIPYIRWGQAWMFYALTGFLTR